MLRLAPANPLTLGCADASLLAANHFRLPETSSVFFFYLSRKEQQLLS
jgi:hypothetical protein